jgi:hypothetical protein
MSDHFFPFFFSLQFHFTSQHQSSSKRTLGTFYSLDLLATYTNPSPICLSHPSASRLFKSAACHHPARTRSIHFTNHRHRRLRARRELRALQARLPPPIRLARTRRLPRAASRMADENMEGSDFYMYQLAGFTSRYDGFGEYDRSAPCRGASVRV